MAGPQRQSAPIEVNKFTGGLLTDISPLNAPQDNMGFAVDMENMELNIDGSINRRLGMDFETDHSVVSTTIINADTENTAIVTFKWTNAGGDPEKSLLVIQVGNEIKIFDLDSQPISDNLIYTRTISGVDRETKFSFTVVDGIMVVATGQKSIYLFQYSEGSISFSTTTLLIRDLFGVADVISGEDLTSGSGVQTRPATRTHAHIYNLRNQSWGIPRIKERSEAVVDPIWFFLTSKDVNGDNIPDLYPSNADAVNQALYPDPADPNGGTYDRFFAADLIANPIGTTRAAQGYFIIDALERGSSRISEEAKNRARFSQLTYAVTSLPQDKTPGGASTITEFAGRIFYAGFSGEIIDGDARSPRLSSYVLFSKIVNSPQDINLCYQEGDPTSKETPDVIDTDGGFIRINGAYGIQKMVNLGSSLIVIATNGIWRITGGTDNGFTATQYIVEKISENGCSNSDSVVVVDASIMYWGDDAIYHIRPDQFGTLGVQNVSLGRIQTFYDDIPLELKRTARGGYDNFERKVRWIYNNRLIDDSEVLELVYNVTLQAFYPNRIKQIGDTALPRPVSIFAGNPYQIVIEPDNVVVGTDTVIASTDNVVIPSSFRAGESKKELFYLTITQITPTISYSFSSYRIPNWYDWVSEDGTGVDASAYAVTTNVSGGDNQRKKSIPYLTIYLRKTETGFTTDVNGDFAPVGGSSCKVQVRWDWTDNNNSGKWGREFQAYRHGRLWFPSSVEDKYADGYSVVKTRNKIRGGGHILCIRYATEEDKNFHLYGWSMIFSEAGNV